MDIFKNFFSVYTAGVLISVNQLSKLFFLENVVKKFSKCAIFVQNNKK